MLTTCSSPIEILSRLRRSAVPATGSGGLRLLRFGRVVLVVLACVSQFWDASVEFLGRLSCLGGFSLFFFEKCFKLIKKFVWIRCSWF